MSDRRVAVVGAGTMGHGIAYIAALAGCEVALTDTRAAALPVARDRLDALRAGGVARGRLTAAESNAVAARVRLNPSSRGRSATPTSWSKPVSGTWPSNNSCSASRN